MPKYKNQTLSKYLNKLADKAPVPGGGSAAALTAASAAALISMVSRYSLGKSKTKSTEDKIKKILKENERIRKRLLTLVDLDVEAYLKVVKARKGTAQQKKVALKAAEKVPQEICRLTYESLKTTPFLVKKGNPHLIGDVQCAVELLLSAFNAAMVFSKQS